MKRPSPTSTPSTKPSLPAVGDSFWHYDPARRAPTVRQKWRKVYVLGEHRGFVYFSLVKTQSLAEVAARAEQAIRVPVHVWKMGRLPASFRRTEEEVDQGCWFNTNSFRIGEALQKVSPALLAQVADFIGYQEPPQADPRPTSLPPSAPAAQAREEKSGASVAGWGVVLDLPLGTSDGGTTSSTTGQSVEGHLHDIDCWPAMRKGFFFYEALLDATIEVVVPAATKEAALALVEDLYSLRVILEPRASCLVRLTPGEVAVLRALPYRVRKTTKDKAVYPKKVTIDNHKAMEAKGYLSWSVSDCGPGGTKGRGTTYTLTSSGRAVLAAQELL